MVLTVFLVILVLALIFGNIFLSIIAPRRMERILGGQNAPPAKNPVQGARAASDEEPFDDRVKMLNTRIERLENILLRLNKTQFVAQKLNGTSLYQKITDLEEFKQNTKLEIAALRQQLGTVSQQPVVRSVAGAPPVDDERLHKLVFRSAE